MVTERPLPDSGTTALGGGTTISGGGTPDRGCGTPFRPVPAEFNHRYRVFVRCFNCFILPGSYSRARDGLMKEQ